MPVSKPLNGKIVTYTLLNKGRADRSSNQDEKPKSVTK